MNDTIFRKPAIEAVEKHACNTQRILDAINALPSAQPERQWIPCSERLPEDDTEVFVYLFNRPSPYIAWVKDCNWFTEDFEVEKEDYPSAWMPLPEPYKEEQDG